MAKHYKHNKAQYTNINQDIFMDNELSFKGKGLLCQMLSLPDDWNFSVEGLATLSKDGKGAVRGMIHELEEAGYLYRERIKGDNIYTDVVYHIFDYRCSNPATESRPSKNRSVENAPQSNTNKSNTNKSNTKNNNNPPKPPKGGKKIPPTIEEVREYAQSRGNIVDPDYFFDYYEGLNWMRGKTKVKDWQATYRTWERNSNAGSKRNETGKSNTSGNGIDYNQFVDVC